LEVGQDPSAESVHEGGGGIHPHHALDCLKTVLGVIELVDATSSVRLHAQALDEDRRCVWREGFPTVDNILEVPLESYCARVHLDTDGQRRGARIVEVDVVVDVGQGSLKSVAGWDTPCGRCIAGF